MAEQSYDTPTGNSSVKRAGESDFPDIQSGRYKFTRVIGSGGTATVYQAFDTSLAKDVAIKKLHNSADETTALRFHREAKLAGVLKHKNVLSALDFGMTEKNEPYLILDFVRGTTLSRRIHKEGALPLLEALEIFIQISDGMSHAHRQNVVHRDIKPSNVMLVVEDDLYEEHSTQIAKVVDFGLAKLLDEQQYLTATGIGVGTPRYMSPEQVQGVGVDQRTDIYGFGCLMHETLTGDPPFDAETALEIAAMQLHEPAPPLPEYFSENLRQIVMRCLEKDLERRYPTFEQLRLDLEQELEAELERRSSLPVPDDVSPVASTEPESTGWSRKKRLALGGYAALVLLVVLAVSLHRSMSTNLPKVKLNPDTESSSKGKVDLVLGQREPVVQIGTKGVWLADGADDEGLSALLSKKLKVVEIDLSDSLPLSEKGFAILRQRTDLRKIVYQARPIDRNNLQLIASIPSLTAVQLGETEDCDFNALRELEKLPNLDTLEFHNVVLDDHAFEEIARFKKLKSVFLQRCKGITPGGMKQISKLNDLVILHFDSCEVSDAALHEIGNLKITNLDLRRAKLMSDKFLLEMADNPRFLPNLTELDIQSTEQITKNAVGRLAAARHGLRIANGKLSVPMME